LTGAMSTHDLRAHSIDAAALRHYLGAMGMGSPETADEADDSCRA
jgi:hypothetical protein